MIKTLEGVEQIDGKKVMTNDDRPKDSQGNVNWEAFDQMRENFPICIDHDKEMISFKMLTKPESDGGNLKLCQLSTFIHTALTMLKYLDKDYPCEENRHTIFHLEQAIQRQEERTADRKARGVEGKYEK